MTRLARLLTSARALDMAGAVLLALYLLLLVTLCVALAADRPDAGAKLLAGLVADALTLIAIGWLHGRLHG